MASRYRQDMQRAWSRIAAIATGKLETRLGTVEYAEQGTGLPVVVCHGVFGCHGDAVDGWWTRMLGEGFRVIAPSRFGYFGHPNRVLGLVLANCRLGGSTQAQDGDQARRAVDADPFVKEGLLEVHWLKQWTPQ